MMLDPRLKQDILGDLRLIGLTATQKIILIALRLHPPGIFKVDLCELVGIQPTYISRSASWLVKNNLISREMRGKNAYYRLGHLCRRAEAA